MKTLEKEIWTLELNLHIALTYIRWFTPCNNATQAQYLYSSIEIQVSGIPGDAVTLRGGHARLGSPLTPCVSFLPPLPRLSTSLSSPGGRLESCPSCNRRACPTWPRPSTRTLCARARWRASPSSVGRSRQPTQCWPTRSQCPSPSPRSTGLQGQGSLKKIVKLWQIWECFVFNKYLKSFILASFIFALYKRLEFANG